MIDLIITFALGALAVCSTQTIWFCSNFPVHIFKTLRIIKSDEDVFDWEDWQIWITTQTNFIGELLTCPVCLSVWISGAVACIQYFLIGVDASPMYIVACLTSWPGLAYLFYKVTGNE